MKISVPRSCISLIVLSVLIEAVTSNENETSTEGRQSRVHGRIVKQYAGHKSDPILCTEEGFKADPVQCSIFYRCLKTSSEKFTVFKFQCGPGTVYDPEKEVCNHPGSTKRADCGGLAYPVEQDNDNEIVQHELPSPISTILPVYTSYKIPVLGSSDIYTPSTEKGYTYSKTHTPNPIRTTTNKYQHTTHTSEAYPGTDYKNTTVQKITSSSMFPTLDKSENCISDGFMGDSENCKKFYRCVSNSRGGFIRYEFMCSDPTIWDDQIQSCNHPWAVRNKRCGDGSISNENSILVNKDKPADQIDVNHDVIASKAPNQNVGNKNKPKEPIAIYGNRLSNSDDVESQIYHLTIPSKDNNIATEPNVYIEDTNGFGLRTTVRAIYSTNKIVESNETQMTESRKSFICTQSGFIGDYNDCKKFYRCVDDGKGSFTKYEFSCSEGTVWDNELEACNYAWAVKECGDTSAVYNSSGTNTRTSTSSTTLLNENIDNGYINQIDQEQSTTITVSTPVSLISTTASSNTIGIKCTMTGFIGDGNDCSKFYKCVDNGMGAFTKYEYKCGVGTLWDQNIEACNHAWAVQSCTSLLNATVHPTYGNSDRTSTTVFLTQSTTPINIENYNEYNNAFVPQQHVTSSTSEINLIETTLRQTNNCKSPGFIGDSNDCKKFYRCVNNGQTGYIQYEFFCGEGTVWDPDIEACNHAWAVKECGKNNSFNNNVKSSSTTSNYYSSNINDVGSITTISYSTPQTLKPQKEINDYESGYNLQQNLNTKKPTIVLQPTTSKQTLEQKNNCLSSGFIGDINNCNKFYRCVDNGNGGFVRYEFSCGDGTVWDPEIEACNHAWAVKQCGGSVTNENISASSTTNFNVEDSNTEHVTQNYIDNENTAPYTQTPIDAVNKNNECRGNGFMGDVYDCRKFYRCVESGNGSFIRYEFSCGEGTLWDSQINACNHAWAVKDCKSISTQISSTVSVEPITTPRNEANYGEYSTTSNKDLINVTENTSLQTTIVVTVTNKINECKSSGFMGDFNDCQKFYRCVENDNGGFIKYEFMCGEGTVWDSKIGACNHKWAVEKCGGNSSNEFVEKTTQSSVVTSPVTVITTTTLLANFTTSTQSSTSIHVVQTHQDTECKSEGFFANPTNCKKFYRCVNDGKNGYTKYEFSCVNGTVWIQEIQACDYDIDAAMCNVSQSLSTTNSNLSLPNTTEVTYPTEISSINNTSDQINVNNNKCTSEGFHAKKDNCQQFYRCVDNGDGTYTKYEFTCADGTAWDLNTQSCSYVSEVEACTSNQFPIDVPAPEEQSTESYTTKSTTLASMTISTKPAKQNTCIQEGYFGQSDNCKNFYRCVYNHKGGYTKYDYTCGEGTIWDEDITACNHPYDVKNLSCVSKEESTSPISTTSTMSSHNDSSLPNTTDKPLSTMPDNNYEINSNCSNNSSSEIPTNKFTCSKAGFFADLSNCKKFYRCVDWENNGKKFSLYHFDCADGTIWDPTLETCNHEDSVYPPRNCNNSTHQQSETEISTEVSTTTNQGELTSEITKTTQQGTTTSYTSSEMQITQSSTTEKPTTQPLTSKETTTQSSTTEELTTKITTEEVTAKSTTQPSTIEEVTTKPTTQLFTTEKTTAIPLSTKEITTQSSTTKEYTTQYTTTTVQSTTETTPQEIVTDATTTESNQEQTTKLSTTQTTNIEMTTATDSTTSVTYLTTFSTEQTTSPTTSEQVITEQSTMTGSLLQTTNSQFTTDEISSSSTTENNKEMSTEMNSGVNQECPDTDNGQSLYVCPTSFKRHPKYCNLFYQCTEDNDSHELKIAVFNCPNNTIYDESKIQCVEQEKSNKKCNGQIAQKYRVKRLGANQTDPFVVTKESMACPSVGHFPFEKHTKCSSTLFKCELTESGQLKGYVYKCPEGFIYWSISRRCEAIRNVRDCKQSSYTWSRRHDIPLERFNIAT